MLNMFNIVMEETIFALRNVDEGTKKFIKNYANEHDLNTGEALREIVLGAKEHFQESKSKKKYKSFFDTYEKLKFNSDPRLSENIDEILYDE